MGNPADSARKIVAVSALIFGVVVGSAAVACPAPDQLRASSLDRAFTQEKFVSGMSKPLKSEGRIIANGDEIVWHMKKPFDVKTTITPDGISQSVDGKPAEASGGGSAEIGAVVAKSMAAMMRGRWSDLKTMFSVTLPSSPGEGGWLVILTPLDERLQSLLGTIAVHGCSDVSDVEIVRPDGDRESVHFDDYSR
ncbi:MAG: hypothetical protein K8R18_14830 [Parvibaculum sp.]|uniref:LolA family protein n=1 Tax=Parvibaculum sp. TaxID=2024848 RepID=UPI0025E5312D|nr:hypothetical protein [Parvibaculum sp.]MCE9650891.1 hypothetical protein [Parvibaculum sp.]